MQLMRRYKEQLGSSFGYHWRVFGECLKMLMGLRFWVAGLLVVLCIFPFMVFLSPLETNEYLDWYTRTPVPAFEFSLSMELETTYYYGKLKDDIPLLLAFNYYWTTSKGFEQLSTVLVIGSLGLLTVAYLREEIPVGDREK